VQLIDAIPLGIQALMLYMPLLHSRLVWTIYRWVLLRPNDGLAQEAY
jgi:hypothetical protein